MTEENSKKSGENAEDSTQRRIAYSRCVSSDTYDRMPEEEIDLADLVGVLYRRKWFIIGCILLLGLAGLAYTLYCQEKYRATTMIEIGKLYSEQGYKNVENAAEAKNRLESLGKAIYGKFNKEVMQKKGSKVKKLPFSIEKDFKIEVPGAGNIISLMLVSAKSPETLVFLSEVNEALKKDHNRIFDKEKTIIKNLIETVLLQNQNIDITIKSLKNKINEAMRKYEEKTAEKENLIFQIQNTIENIKAAIAFVEGRIKLLVKEKETLHKRIESAEDRYNEFLQHKFSANEQARGSGAVGLMLFSSEMQHMRTYLDQLRERLLFKIPEEISKLGTELKELNSEINNHQADLSLEKKRLAQLKPEMEDLIEEIQGSIEEKQFKKKENQLNIEFQESRIKNMITTDVLFAPHFSEDKISPNVKLIIALSIIVGLFFGIFGAFILEFWQRNKEAILQG